MSAFASMFRFCWRLPVGVNVIELLLKLQRDAPPDSCRRVTCATFTMATVHLISGLPGAGKSTYAQQLQLRTDAVVFTLDRFLITMFGRYHVPDVGGEEHVRRVLACREVIWMAAERLLMLGSDVILDDGYFLREHRRKVVDAAVALGASAKIHFIDTPLDEIRRRLLDRNQNLPVFNFAIEPETLEGCVRLFEAPSDADAAEVIVVERGRTNG